MNTLSQKILVKDDYQVTKYAATPSTWKPEAAIEKVFAYPYFLDTVTNPLPDSMRTIDATQVKVYDHYSYTLNKLVSTWTWGDKDYIQKVNIYSFFLVTAKNPLPDTNRGIDATQIKVIDNYAFTLTRAPATWTWDPSYKEHSIQPLTIYDNVLTTVVHPATDDTRGIEAQTAKFYDNFIITVDCPPWCRADVDITPELYCRWEQHKLDWSNLTVHTTIAAFQFHYYKEHLDITDTVNAQNWQFVNDYCDNLTATDKLGVTWEQHNIREKMIIDDGYVAIQIVPFKNRLNIAARINKVENIQYADHFQTLNIRPRLTADITWGETENSKLVMSATLSVHSEQTHIHEKGYFSSFFGQFETIPYKNRLRITTDFAAEANNPKYEFVSENALWATWFSGKENNPQYVDYTDRGQWRTIFDTKLIDPPLKINATLKISSTYTTTVTNPGSGGGGSGGISGGEISYADAQEDLQHYIYISPSFHTSETVRLREVLAITTWANHTPHSNALLREGLAIRFTENSERHNPNKIEASLVIKDFLKISTEQLANLLEYVRISDHYYTKGGSSDEATITYVVNEGNETTRYEHWPFESYAAFKGMYLGCCADGVYVLSGDNDNGEPIEAMINFGKQSFGSANYKRVPYVYASLAGDGDVYLQVSYNEDEQYMYPARKVDEYNATARFDLGRGIKANYLTFELYNENGSKFDLRNLWIYLTELSRRI